jgi:modification methylase
LEGEKIVADVAFIMAKNGAICHNSGVICHNFRDGLPPNPVPQLFIGKAEDMNFLGDKTVDIIITSPPYNLGQEKWPMGGNGRTPREAGIGYSEYEDNMPEDEYEEWQIKCLKECYRVAKPGASMFYNHKVRQKLGGIIHPILWLQHTTSWNLRQEIIWDRLSTHNHTTTLFWPQDERIYWLKKGKPNLLNKSINLPSVWREFGPIPKNGGHPAPFTPALPKMILKAVGKPGDTILDPFGGSMTTCLVASALGYKSIGVDIAADYVEQARALFQE